jgi:3-oxoadipate enol-lactonase
MNHVHSSDADIAYEVMGSGHPVVLLHPFPADHEFWLPSAQALVSHYRLILPDLRGHGQSGIGEGPATMQKHAADLIRILGDARADRAAFVGISIGGYILFEFWRRSRERVSALALCNTKAPADSPEAKAARLQAAADVSERGVEPFFQSMVPRLIGKTTRDTRPDRVEGALRMMRKMSPEDVSQVQRGMAERLDSISTLKTINVPTLIVTGDEDILTGPPEAEVMQRNIPGSEMKIMPRAGHFSPWEQPELVGTVLRQFLDSAVRA